MLPKLKISSFLIKRFEKQSNQSSGCLFGVFYGDKTLLLLGFNTESSGSYLNHRQIKYKFPAELDLCGVVKFDDPTAPFQPPSEVIKETNIIFKDIDITDNPILLNCPIGSVTGMKASIFIHEKLEEIPFEIMDEQELYRDFCFTRLRCHLNLYTEETQEAVKENIQKLRKSLAYGSLAFRIPKTKAYLTGGGETGSHQTMPNNTTIENILDLLANDELLVNKKTKTKKKTNVKNQSIEDGPNEFKIVDIDVLKNKTKEINNQTEQIGSAFSMYIDRKEEKLRIPLEIDSMAILYRNTKLLGLYDILIESICRSLRLIENTLIERLKEMSKVNVTNFDNVMEIANKQKITKPEIFHFQPSELGHFLSVVYLTEINEDEIQVRRKKLHHLFGLKLTRPYFKRANKFIFQDEIKPNSPLVNTHIGLRPSGVKDGQQYLVQGKYTYFHYMQHNFNDNGWGCAYRSLQTLCSWFKWQGYVERDPPNHEEIQKYLVKIKDKQNNFVGSRLWIGSTEVSMCLQGFLGVDSKILHCNSGSDLQYKGSDLLVHFETQGTPIMIGGGVLAHTIIGIDYNNLTGEIKFLILDPHYTDSDDLSTIQGKGWCGWKGIDFWDKKSYYNLCMPQRPISY